MKTIGVLLFAFGCLALTSCRTADPNPSSPQADTGYVDFYTDSSLGLAWEVKRMNEGTGEFKTVFSEFDPVPGTVLRVTAPPGNHKFQVWFRNWPTEGPQTVSVEVQNGKVTPVHVTLTPVGSATIKTKEYGFRPSAKGYGRGTKVSSQATDVSQIGATAEVAQAYKTKEAMSYFKPGAP